MKGLLARGDRHDGRRDRSRGTVMSHFLPGATSAVPCLTLGVISPPLGRLLVPGRGRSLRPCPGQTRARRAAVPAAMVAPPADHHERAAEPARKLPRVALLLGCRLSLLDGSPAAIGRDLPSATTAATTDVRKGLFESLYAVEVGARSCRTCGAPAFFSPEAGAHPTQHSGYGPETRSRRPAAHRARALAHEFPRIPAIADICSNSGKA